MPDSNWQADIALLQERTRKARAILGVPKSAARQEIRRAFRQASLAHHPDVNGNDEESLRRFHLACCAYKFLTEGEFCAALDELGSPPPELKDGKYQMDNPWGYWCWWRENFFGT